MLKPVDPGNGETFASFAVKETQIIWNFDWVLRNPWVMLFNKTTWIFLVFSGLIPNIPPHLCIVGAGASIGSSWVFGRSWRVAEVGGTAARGVVGSVRGSGTVVFGVGCGGSSERPTHRVDGRVARKPPAHLGHLRLGGWNQNNWLKWLLFS